MRILITGAFGYVGYSVVKDLLEKGKNLDIVLYDLISKNNRNFFFFNEIENNGNKIRIFNNDILDNYHLKKAVEGVDVVIHLAAKVSTPYADHDPHGFDQVNNWGTACVVDSLSEAIDCKKIIFLSSASVYGHTGGRTIDELYSAQPKTFYGISKLKAENQIKRVNSNISPYILRSANVVGFNPCIRFDAVFNKFAFNAHYLKKILISGSGEQKRAFIYVNNLSKIITAIVLDEVEAAPDIYNLVDFNISINELYQENLKLTPDFDCSYVNQNVEMRSISIKSTSTKFQSYLETKSPGELIEEIRSNFSIPESFLVQ